MESEVLIFFSIIELGPKVVKAINWLRKTAYGWVEKKKRLHELQEELFWSWKDTGNVDPGCAHPKILRNLIHPDNRIALKGIYASIYGVFEGRRQFKAVETVGMLDRTKNVCSIGSPMSTMMSRIGMGYEINNKKLGKPPKTKLPIYFDFNEEKLDRVTRKLHGKTWTVGNWTLVDTTDKTFDGTPMKLRDDTLKTDFLLITVMPNTLSQEGFDNNMVHAICAGCHGQGTRATKLVLENLDILERIYDEKGSASFFQTIIKVPELKHTHKDCIPKRVEYVKTIPLKKDMWY